MKQLAVITLLALTVTASWWYFQNRRLPTSADVESWRAHLATGVTETKEKQEFDQNVDVLVERAQNVSTETQKVLGTAVQVNQAAKEKPLTERAIDHSLYLYCKGIVAEYEQE